MSPADSTSTLARILDRRARRPAHRRRRASRRRRCREDHRPDARRRTAYRRRVPAVAPLGGGGRPRGPNRQAAPAHRAAAPVGDRRPRPSRGRCSAMRCPTTRCSAPRPHARQSPVRRRRAPRGARGRLGPERGRPRCRRWHWIASGIASTTSTASSSTSSSPSPSGSRCRDRRSRPRRDSRIRTSASSWRRPGRRGWSPPTDRCFPIVRITILQGTPDHELWPMRRELVDAIEAAGLPLGATALELALHGFRDPRVAEGAAAHRPTKRCPPSRSTHGASTPPRSKREATWRALAGRRAQAAWAAGDIRAAERLVDGVLTGDRASRPPPGDERRRGHLGTEGDASARRRRLRRPHRGGGLRGRAARRRVPRSARRGRAGPGRSSRPRPSWSIRRPLRWRSRSRPRGSSPRSTARPIAPVGAAPGIERHERVRRGHSAARGAGRPRRPRRTQRGRARHRGRRAAVRHRRRAGRTRVPEPASTHAGARGAAGRPSRTRAQRS